MTTVTIQLEEKIYNKLAEIAQHEDRSKSSVIRRALLKYIEDQRDIKALEESYQDYIASDKKTYTLEEIKKEDV
jgi:predicted transcriptional regulator